jgi:Raf kinase inhibitor-like YbhB/YbcL family protein
MALALVIFFVAYRVGISRNNYGAFSTIAPAKNMGNLILSSSAFKAGETIPARFTCDGDNKNPSLSISGVSEKAKSLVLIVDDPDAPMGVWNHWLVWNINPQTTSIGEGEIPAGTVGKNSGGNFRYDGPCPPSGTHRYFFKLYELDAKLDLPADSPKAAVEQAISGHLVDSTQLMGLYSHK